MITDALSKDPIMKSLIDKFGKLSLTESKDYFNDLINNIIGQMLSNKAAETIYKRVAALCADGVSPKSILAVSDQALRLAGSSYGKIKCMKALAQSVVDKAVDLENIKKYSDEEVIGQLTTVKGIGRWTAEMFLIFSLAREDIFSFGDGGLNSSINKLYGDGAILSKAEIKAITEKWHPYRSYASLYLWQSLDNRPVL